MTTFPSITSVTFAFGSNEDPLSTGWTGSTPSGNTTNLLKSASGVCSKNQPSSTGFGAQYTSSSYGPDMEAWCKVVTLTATAGQEILGIYLRLQQEGAATVDGYNGFVVLSAGTDTWEIDRLVNNSGTSIATGSKDIAAGDFIGMKVEDSGGNPVVSMYWCAAASDPTVSGNWTQVCTATDSNAAKITGTGKIALEVQGTVTTLDDLRAGTIVTGGGGATVTAVAATAAGSAPVAAVSASYTATAPAALALGSAPAAAVSGTGSATVTAVPALATGDTPNAVITAGSTVTAAVSLAAGSAPPANSILSSVVNAVAVVALGSAPVASVSGGGSATVSAVPALALGSAPAAALSSGQVVTAVVADATGQAPAAVVSAGAGVSGVPALAVGQAVRPTVSPAPAGGTGVSGDVAATFAEASS